MSALTLALVCGSAVMTLASEDPVNKRRGLLPCSIGKDGVLDDAGGGSNVTKIVSIETIGGGGKRTCIGLAGYADHPSGGGGSSKTGQHGSSQMSISPASAPALGSPPHYGAGTDQVFASTTASASNQSAP